VYGDNVKIIAIPYIREVSVSIYFVSEGQITPTPAVIVEKVVTERNICLLFGGEVGNGHCGALLKKERSGMFVKVSLL
jgi:hypothetical protein